MRALRWREDDILTTREREGRLQHFLVGKRIERLSVIPSKRHQLQASFNPTEIRRKVLGELHLWFRSSGACRHATIEEAGRSIQFVQQRLGLFQVGSRFLVVDNRREIDVHVGIPLADPAVHGGKVIRFYNRYAGAA
jgi:hypothetical protein